MGDNPQFQFDVFLSHSSKDKSIVQPLATRLKSDGLRVWFDEWEIKPGDNIPAKIEEGLEHSRVLVLCMSASAFGSDWAQLESGTFRFRDPLNKDRRFIPLRLDDAPIKGSLAQFLHINWLPEKSKQEYARLLDACRPTAEVRAAEASKSVSQVDSEPIPAQHQGLQLRVNPTRDRLRQLAQIRLLNTGERPILLDAWFVVWADKSGSSSSRCERGTLPVRLQDHERADLLVDISDHPIEQLEGLGVVDAEQRSWRVNEQELRRFIQVAKLHRPPKSEPRKEEPTSPSNVAIVSPTFASKDLGADVCATTHSALPPDQPLSTDRSLRELWHAFLAIADEKNPEDSEIFRQAWARLKLGPG